MRGGHPLASRTALGLVESGMRHLHQGGMSSLFSATFSHDGTMQQPPCHGRDQLFGDFPNKIESSSFSHLTMWVKPCWEEEEMNCPAIAGAWLRVLGTWFQGFLLVWSARQDASLLREAPIGSLLDPKREVTLMVSWSEGIMVPLCGLAVEGCSLTSSCSPSHSNNNNCYCTKKLGCQPKYQISEGCRDIEGRIREGLLYSIKK